MKKFLSREKVKKVLTTIVSGAVLSLIFCMDVFAGSIGNSKLVTGTTNIVKDLTTAATKIIAALTILISLFYGIKWYFADVETKPREAKTIKTTVIVGVILTCISGGVTAVLSYYK